MRKDLTTPQPAANNKSSELWSFSDIQQGLKDNSLNCQRIVDEYLQTIHQKKHLNVFLEVYEDEARQRAEEIDKKRSLGTAGKLAGMVVGIKDVLCYEGHGVQGGSKILNGFRSKFSSTVVQRLLDQDAMIIGRQNCDEFAMGSSTENSAFGPTLNEADTTRVPGGSSGGSAVSVQAGMCTVSLGSDTGGSVRQPAAFCGVVGLKPTYSRVSRHGLLAYASSFDCIGSFSHTVEDSALLLETIAGADNFDSTVSRRAVPAYTKSLALDKKVKVAYLKETIENEGLNEDIKAKTIEKLDFLRAEGHTVEAADFPLLQYVLPTYYLLTMAEASSNLSRYDGVKYGFRSKQTQDLLSMYKKTRTEGFGEEVKRRIMLGTFVLSASYYDAYYTKAQKMRRLLTDATRNILKEYDFIVLPTTPTTAFRLGEHADPLEMYLADLFTVQASIAGVPAISIPNGEGKNGLPVGFQVIADLFQEDKLFAFSRYLLGK